MRDEVKSGKPVTETIEQYRREHPGALERAEAEILAEEAANAEIIPFVQSTKATNRVAQATEAFRRASPENERLFQEESKKIRKRSPFKHWLERHNATESVQNANDAELRYPDDPLVYFEGDLKAAFEAGRRLGRREAK